MGDRRDEDGWSSGGLREHISQADESFGDLGGMRGGADVQGINHVVRAPGPTEIVIAFESAGRDHMQARENLEGRSKPYVDLIGDRRRDGDGGRDGPTHWRVIESRAHDVKREFGSLERRAVTRTGESRGCGDLGGAGANSAVPQESVDLCARRAAGLVDAGEAGESGEGVAQ